MSHNANPQQRNRLIAGLRAFAAYLESNPGVPVPERATIYVFPPRSTNEEQRKEIDAIAARISAEPYEITSGHYTVSRYFGPIEYCAVAIDRRVEPARTEGK